ncbi:MAG: M14 family zinc carboxypeptidase, partial [Candidatus Neomarinimicrobiota bacterium]
MKYFNLILIKCLLILLCLIGFVLHAGIPEKSEITNPEKHFGFKPGTDKMLFDYEKLISYLKKLDAASPKLKLVNIGKSSQNREMFIAFISSEQNINNLTKLKEINRQLALTPNLTNSHKKQLISDGKVFFLATLSMHSSEVGPAQSAPAIAYDLITTDDPLTIKWLDDVVYMMVPCHNPDGMDMIVNHFNKYKNTKWDGSSLPGVYHEYVGHNINRDFVTLSQDETKAISNIYTEWFPQVMVEKHQMWSSGPRYFVPPNHDPIAQNINEALWNWTWVFGSNISKDMTKAGLAGVSQQYAFDNYWPGSTETCLWKGVIAMLTEAASTQYGNPIYVEQNELSVFGKGLSEYKKSINMPLPWEG